jgi:hypothetical protein
MVLTLIAQGTLFYIRDFVTPNPLPRAFMISDWLWVLLVASSFLYFKKPIVTIVAGFITFVCFSVLLEKFSDDHTFVWFLYRHSLLLLFIAAAQLGVLCKRKAQIRVHSRGKAGKPPRNMMRR